MINHLPPLSLYIHIPWCVKKCPYCDFNSHTTQEIPEKAYLAQLKKDLLADLVFVKNRPLSSIFFGGGTPSIMSPAFYKALLSFIGEHIEVNAATEITLEANPGTTESSKFFGYRDAGINRLSIGVQSFQTHQLEKLGRIHSGNDAIRAIRQAKQAGSPRRVLRAPRPGKARPLRRCQLAPGDHAAAGRYRQALRRESYGDHRNGERYRLRQRGWLAHIGPVH